MNINKTTKRALGSSIVALLICCTMLIGTTYAWFTDSVTSSGNKIQSGTLDVAFTWSDDYVAAEDAWNNVEDENAPAIFDYALWEPGYTQVRYLKVENKGSLALKYKLQIVTNGALTQNGVKLSDAINVYYATSKVDVPDRDLDNNANLKPLGTLTQFLSGGAIINDTLLSGEGDYATLVLQMDTAAGNEYQGLSVGTTFDIMLFATQYTYEEDSFDENYDYDAIFAGTASAPVVPGENTELIITTEDGKTKVATVLVPADAVADGAVEINAVVNESDYQPQITVNAGDEVVTVDLSVLGIKEGNTTLIKTQYFIGKGYDPATVSVYHYDELIGAGSEAYNPSTGYVIFETTGFSPFTFVYDKDSVYEGGIADPSDLPVASVVNSPEYENVDLPWENYGSWSPTEGLDSQLEAAFTFACTQTAEEVEASAYRSWFCDFYVSLDRDLGPNQLFLGGNYGSFGWVGFHNGDLELEANTEIPLLGSVTQNPWTYEDIADFVSTFVCGVGDVDNALSGATFTVMLRLTNPDNEAEFYNVATIEYTFN